MTEKVPWTKKFIYDVNYRLYKYDYNQKELMMDM